MLVDAITDMRVNLDKYTEMLYVLDGRKQVAAIVPIETKIDNPVIKNDVKDASNVANGTYREQTIHIAKHDFNGVGITTRGIVTKFNERGWRSSDDDRNKIKYVSNILAGNEFELDRMDGKSRVVKLK